MPTARTADVEVPGRLVVSVPAGARVVVVSDLHLGERADAGSEATATELAQLIESWDGAGVVVLAGDCFELLAVRRRDPTRALAAHPRLSSALASFGAADGCSVVVLTGNHDSCLGWDPQAIAVLRGELHARVAFSVVFELSTGSGEQRVLVEHGHQFDPANAFVDPRNPNETPLGYHVVADVLPRLRTEATAWLQGLDRVADPTDVAAVVASRLFYRCLARPAALLLVPVSLAIIAAGLAALSSSPVLGAAARAMGLGAIGLVVAVLVGSAWWAAALRRPLRSLSAGLSGVARPGNDAPRSAARQLVTDGYAGLITGHTHQPELVDLGGGFYANSGCGGEVLHRRVGRLGLPPTFAPTRHTSWVELETGASLHVRLVVGQREVAGTTLLERLATRPVRGAPARPSVVTSWSGGEPWPVHAGSWERRHRVRRIAALVIAGAGLLNLASAVTPPLGSRLVRVTDLVPLAVSQAAAVFTALAGVALLMLGRGVRRGQRVGWALAVGLLLSSAILHVVKGLDVEEGLLAATAAAWLATQRAHFRVRPDHSATRRGLFTLVGGAFTAIAAGVLATEAFSGRSPRPSLGRALSAVAGRMVGVTSVDLPARIDAFVTPTLLATSVGLVIAVGWLLFQPVIASRLAARPPEAIEQARRLVAAHGDDTLAYFALRDDKRWFFTGDTVVAYAVHQGICLVSPDPIGPLAARRDAWAAFRQFADDHGWPVAVMGASEPWLAIYRASGMNGLYVGDEAVVDVRRFELDGGRNKSLRQAVNRVARHGYTVELHDPARVPAGLEADLRALMTESRQGEGERGFSMTLGRLFDRDDEGLLLAVCTGPDGRPAAFCQFVPARGVQGYSLDLMRRSAGDHPNGLTDFVVVRTIEHLRAQGGVGLGLNFAVMRSVLAGERGDRMAQRAQRWLLGRLGDSMQIESLWRFNAKFDPDWVPRYAMYDAPEHLVSAAMALARAESFTELPLIGRFLKPRTAPVRESGPEEEEEEEGPDVPAAVEPTAADSSSTFRRWARGSRPGSAR